MSVGILSNVNGSISNRVVASNIKNGWSFPDNLEILGIDCFTPQNKELESTDDDMVNCITIGEYGMAGLSFNSQRCAHSLKTRIEQAILRAEEKSIVKGNTIKILYATMLPTGTASTVTPIVSTISNNLGLNPLIFSIVPDNLSETYQLINTINGVALSSFNPIIIATEDYAELVPEDTRIRARLAACGDPSKFYIKSQFSMELSCKIARLVSGLSKTEKNKNDENEGEDELSFLDAEDEVIRNQSVELETAIGGRQELFVMHYAHSQNNNFEEMCILKPSIKPECPGDPLVFVEYNSSTMSEDEVGNTIRSSLENQDLQPERLFFMPSDHNEIIALIPTKIPERLKNLIKYVKKDKNLSDVLEKWARKTILSNIPPIRRGKENEILTDRLNKIFYQDKSEVEDLAKTLGFSLDLDELKMRNLLFYLAEEEDVFLRPIGGEL